MISAVIKVGLGGLVIIAATLFLQFTCPGHQVVCALGIENACLRHNC